MSEKANATELPRYTLSEEIFNSISHGVAAALAIAGMVVMIVAAAFSGDPYRIVSACIYGACLTILFTMSTIYHSIPNQKVKKVLRVFDHNSIFLLIGGTYTPLCLVTLREYNVALGWTMFGFVWGACIVGIIFKSINLNKYKVLGMICYIVYPCCKATPLFFC